MKCVKAYTEDSQSLPTYQCGPESCSMSHLDTEVCVITFRPHNQMSLKRCHPALDSFKIGYYISQSGLELFKLVLQPFQE